MNKKKNILKLILIIGLLISPQISYSQSNEVLMANNYASNEEYEKAYEIYKKLEKKRSNIPYIHREYYKLLFLMNKFDEAEKYINKVINWNKNQVTYLIDKGMIYYTLGDKKKIEDYFSQLIKKSEKIQLPILASQLYSKRLFKYALTAYLTYEKSADKNNISNVILQIASLYAITNQKELMIERYLSYLEKNPLNISYIQSVMQIYLVDDEEREILRESLFEKIQKNSKKYFYREMLIWLEIQEKNFDRAFIQAKSLDKLKKSEGMRIDKVAKIAYQNKNFSSSLEMYKYLVENYPKSSNYYYFKKELIKSKEGVLKSNKNKISPEKIVVLINDYDEIVQKSTIPMIKIEAKKRQAKLYAFYLHNYEKSIGILEELLKTNIIDKKNKAEIKILLADIYILSGEMWESALLYFQVEKENKETEVGHLARLKNAELSFYRGDFDLAQNQLNILKLATSRKIANDALDLSMLIEENKEDKEILESYANIKLLFLQNKNKEALEILDMNIKSGNYHRIIDKMLLMRANFYKKKGNYIQSLEDLSMILEKYSSGLLVDDALYLKGMINEEFLNEKSKAMKNYEQLIKNYPGSFYVNEARKRYRKLRGDYL